MNNKFKNKMVDGGTTPKFNTGMFFSVHTNTSPVALKDCSGKGLSKEQTKPLAKTSKEDSIEEQLIHRQDEIINTLEKQISEAERELYEKDKEIARLENDLEEVCEEL